MTGGKKSYEKPGVSPWIRGGGIRVPGGERVEGGSDFRRLGLAPLGLDDRGTWDPVRDGWLEEGGEIEEWMKPVIAAGERREYEMEQVVPGTDPYDSEFSPIYDAVDALHAGHADEALGILDEILAADLRCLDAHAHVGNILFELDRPGQAIRHYELGVRIGELSLQEGFDGVLPWGWLDNRPFLRCLHGWCLCLWRLGRFEEAQAGLQRMIMLNPQDNLGARIILEDVMERREWTPG